MRFSKAALVAGFIATSSAFLLPPNIEEFKDEIKDARFRGAPKHFKDLIHSLLEQKTTVVDLECPGCLYASARSEENVNGLHADMITWQEDVENVIHLEFDTQDNALNLNGNPLLSFDKTRQIVPIVPTAHQIRKDDGQSQQPVDLDLSFTLEVLPAIPSPHRDDVSMIPIEFTLLGLNYVPVKVNTISFKVIQTPDGGHVIVHTEEIPFKDTPGAETCEGARPWALCRVKAMIASRLKAVMEATKEKANKVHGWVKDKTSGCGKGRGFFRDHPHPHGDHPHRPHWKNQHGHRYRHHRFGHVLRQTVRFFIIPALLGVIGGLLASAIGMLVGQALIYLWFRTYRNGQRGPLRIYEREIAIIDGEQDGLLGETEEALPKYEDAPKYEEAMGQDLEANSIGAENEKQ